MRSPFGYYVEQFRQVTRAINGIKLKHRNGFDSISFDAMVEQTQTGEVPSEEIVNEVAKILGVTTEAAEIVFRHQPSNVRQANLKRFEELQAKEAAMIAEQRPKKIRPRR